jgi:hypothetical protein
MIPRTLSNRLKGLAGPFSVGFLTAPRYSGKTTLVRAAFPEFRCISLEVIQRREEAPLKYQRDLSFQPDFPIKIRESKDINGV